jgi:hypothetical protein
MGEAVVSRAMPIHRRKAKRPFFFGRSISLAPKRIITAIAFACDVDRGRTEVIGKRVLRRLDIALERNHAAHTGDTRPANADLAVRVNLNVYTSVTSDPTSLGRHVSDAARRKQAAIPRECSHAGIAASADGILVDAARRREAAYFDGYLTAAIAAEDPPAWQGRVVARALRSHRSAER